MIVSLTIVRYRKSLVPFALLAMAVHRLPLMLSKKCSFWKLLGSGRNGTFDLQPDWQQWGLLAVWDDRKAFNNFYNNSFINTWWNNFTTEKWTVLCEPLQSHGKWDGREPFGKPDAKVITGPVAILTRATIKLNRLNRFWSNVDNVANIMIKAPGFITSLGVGEAPIYRQATFSIWKSIEDVKAFAYTSKEHAEVIKKTRSENWYNEELFARFKIVDSFGTINDKNPLDGIEL
jgi:heme-degrading monooxygenase HmoA